MQWIESWVNNESFLWSLILANIPMYWLIGYVFFGNWQNFFVSILYLFKDDTISALDGEWHEDRSRTVSFLLFAIVCFLLVISEYVSLRKYFAIVDS